MLPCQRACNWTCSSCGGLWVQKYYNSAGGKHCLVPPVTGVSAAPDLPPLSLEVVIITQIITHALYIWWPPGRLCFELHFSVKNCSVPMEHPQFVLDYVMAVVK